MYVAPYSPRRRHVPEFSSKTTLLDLGAEDGVAPRQARHMVRDHFAATVQATGQSEPRVLTATFTRCSTPNCGKWACTDGFCRNCPKEAKIVSPQAKPRGDEAPTVVPQCVCAPLRAAKLEWEGWPQADRDECLLCLPADRMKLLTTERSNEGGDPDDGLVWHDMRSAYECACGAQYTELQHMSGASAHIRVHSVCVHGIAYALVMLTCVHNACRHDRPARGRDVGVDLHEGRLC